MTMTETGLTEQQAAEAVWSIHMLAESLVAAFEGDPAKVGLRSRMRRIVKEAEGALLDGPERFHHAVEQSVPYRATRIEALRQS